MWRHIEEQRSKKKTQLHRIDSEAIYDCVRRLSAGWRYVYPEEICFASTEARIVIMDDKTSGFFRCFRLNVNAA